jgi:hypothetical protein
VSPFDQELKVAKSAVQAAGESLMSWEMRPEEKNGRDGSTL